MENNNDNITKDNIATTQNSEKTDSIQSATSDFQEDLNVSTNDVTPIIESTEITSIDKDLDTNSLDFENVISNTDIQDEESLSVAEPADTEDKMLSLELDKNKINKKEKTHNYVPGTPKKLFVDVRDEDEFTFIDKIKHIFSDSYSLYTFLMYFIIVINLIGITIFAKNGSLSITQSLLYKLHFDSLNLETYSFLELSIVTSYFFTFIFGGVIAFTMIKLASLLIKSLELIFSHRIIISILLVFISIFAIFTLYSGITSGGLLTTATYNWLSPLCAFAGGLCMYLISFRNIDIY